MKDIEDERFRGGLLAAVRHMRSYARALCRDADRADDLVQEALLRAWANRNHARNTDNLLPWLLKILRNAFLAGKRKHAREAEDPDERHALLLAVDPRQELTVAVSEVMAALNALSDDQRQALVLIYLHELSYAEAASLLGCALGTLKSRLARGRECLASKLGIQLYHDAAALEARAGATAFAIRPSDEPAVTPRSDAPGPGESVALPRQFDGDQGNFPTRRASISDECDARQRLDAACGAMNVDILDRTYGDEAKGVEQIAPTAPLPANG